MSYTLKFSAEDVERRLLKVADLAIHEAEEIAGIIEVSVDHFIEDGSEIKFRAPNDCTAVTRLRVHYQDENNEEISNIFAFADANGNDISEVNNLFAKDAVVKVVIDLPVSLTDRIIKTKANGEIAYKSLQELGLHGVAFVQNADTNQYLEDKFDAVDSRFESVVNSIDVTVSNATQDMVKISQDPANAGKVLTINAEGNVIPDDINAFYTDEEATNTSTVPLNADTLGGNPASYFATKTDLSQYATKEDLNDVSGSGGAESGVISINGKKGVVSLTATDINALASTGGTVTGPVTFNGIILKEGIDFGPTLPSTAQVGQVFFLEVDD